MILKVLLEGLGLGVLLCFVCTLGISLTGSNNIVCRMLFANSFLKIQFRRISHRTPNNSIAF